VHINRNQEQKKKGASILNSSKEQDNKLKGVIELFWE